MAYYSGAGSELLAAKQSSYSSNSGITEWKKLNITSATFDPSVEKGSEETLLKNKVKDGSYLFTITMDGSISTNLRPEFADWVFEQALGVSSSNTYTLSNAGVKNPSSTLVFKKGNSTFTYPAMKVKSMTLNCPNNDFVTCDLELTGREQIKGSTTDSPLHYKSYETATASDYTKSGYVVTKGVFQWGGTTKCISSFTLNLDNGLQEAPRCYQDGPYIGEPLPGLRVASIDFSMPYDSDFIDTLQEDYLMDTAYGSISVKVTSADNENEYFTITVPHISVTSVSAGVSGTGVIESSVSADVCKPASAEPLTITLTHAPGNLDEE